MFRGFRPTLGYVFWFSRRFSENQTNLRENQTYKTKTKEHQKHLRENQQTKVFKGFRPTLGYGFGLVCFLLSRRFLEHTKKHSGKSKIQKQTKESHTNVRENQKTKLLKVSDPPLDMFFGFPEGFYKTNKTFGNTNKNKQTTNPYPRVGLKPLRTLFFGFPEAFFGFLWLLYFWFSRRVFWFSKNLRENKKTISKGGYETFKNFVFACFPEGFLGFLRFLCIFGFPDGFSRWSRPYIYIYIYNTYTHITYIHICRSIHILYSCYI